MPDRPNVLFLLSDEHSYRAMSRLDPSGEGEPTLTPTLDSLAERGVAFERAYCQVPLCTPSRICMLTGLNPMRSGGWENSSPINDERPTIGSSFTQAGYATALVGKMHLAGPSQSAGFSRRPYGDLTGGTGHQWEPLNRRGGRGLAQRTQDAGITEIPESALQEQITADETIAFVREHTAADPDTPWMACASFSRPHFPLTAPKRWWDYYWPNRVTRPKVGRTGDTANHPMTEGMAQGFKTERIEDEEMMKARAGYFACVSYLDEVIDDLLTRLERSGELENTIIVYTSDHGELMGEHGMWWKNSWHEGASHVPWLVQTPEHRQGELEPASLRSPVSLADLYPTLCGMTGIDAPNDLEGVDLSAVIRSGDEPSRGPALFVNPTPRWGPGSEHCVAVDGSHKYVGFPDPSWDLLFDLDADPYEQHNLLSQQGERAAELRQVIDGYWNFEAAAEELDRSRTRKQALPPKPHTAGGNLYRMPDGRLVDAETPLYDPQVVEDTAWT